MDVGGVVLDVDGVLVDSPHERAWRESLETLMQTEWSDIAPQTRWAPERFTSAVYQEVVAGKPRESGAEAALDHFGVPDARARAERYAAAKQERFVKLIEQGDFVAFPDAVPFLLGVKARGLPAAAASSSRNASLLLRKLSVGGLPEHPRPPGVTAATTLIELFDANLSGHEVARGKPAPDIFLAAAEMLSVPPERSLVVEDAPAGIQAAKAAGMAALGVARKGEQGSLLAAGADRVVKSLDEVDLDALVAVQLAPRGTS